MLIPETSVLLSSLWQMGRMLRFPHVAIWESVVISLSDLRASFVFAPLCHKEENIALNPK